MAPDHDVVEHRHVVEQRQVLEGAADAERGARVAALSRGDVAAVGRTAALGRPVAAGDAIHDRGLAGAVGADDREQLAVFDGEADIGQRPDAAEAQGHAAHFKTGSHQTNPSR